MLRRLRRKFVLVGAGSFALVLFVLAVGINCAVYYFNARSADGLLSDMAALGGELPRPEGPGMQRPWDYPLTEETPFETRYFAVRVDSSGEADDIQLDFVSAVDTEGALECLNEAMATGKESGYVGRYRFLAYSGSGASGTLYLFLDCSRQQRTQELVLLVSAFGFAAVLAVASLVLFALSRKAISPVAASVERQKRFITDAGHELKTPITAIMAAADVLELDLPDNEWVESIHHSGARLAKLTADLIDLSRFDEAQPFSDIEAFDLADELSGLCEDFRLTAGAQGRSVLVDITPGISVNGSREALSRVAGILLDNALRYSDDGTDIGVSLCKRHRHAVFEVANRCSGMTRETLTRMFERFYRGDAARSSAGNGIGLSMAQAIVEAHGGRIGAVCTDGAVAITVVLSAV